MVALLEAITNGEGLTTRGSFLTSIKDSRLMNPAFSPFSGAFSIPCEEKLKMKKGIFVGYYLVDISLSPVEHYCRVFSVLVIDSKEY